MGDLYFGDVTDEAAYPDETILRDIRSFIASDQREGQMLDYKADLSPKVNWPETVAAFANSFGGLIVFGVEGAGDQPRRLTGFDPKGVETKTRLGSTILSRIRPRPDFHVRVVRFDEDSAREVAILRVAEGIHTPYVHSKGDEHRIYVRVGAQKAEADNLHLHALFERRLRIESHVALSPDQLQKKLNVRDPSGKQRFSDHFYRFLVIPNASAAARPLTSEVEQWFVDCISGAFGGPFFGPNLERQQDLTSYCLQTDGGKEQRFGLDSQGIMGFEKQACERTNDTLYFSHLDLMDDLTTFLIAAIGFYERVRYYGSFRLNLALVVPEAKESKRHTFKGRLISAGLFDPPFDVILANFGNDFRLELHPATSERIQRCVEEALNQVARASGSVLGPGFRPLSSNFVADALARRVSR